jgi:hypothetical protein
MRYASPVRWEGQSLLCPYPYRAPKDPSRRVRYDRAQLIPEVFLVESAFRTIGFKPREPAQTAPSPEAEGAQGLNGLITTERV